MTAPSFRYGGPPSGDPARPEQCAGRGDVAGALAGICDLVSPGAILTGAGGWALGRPDDVRAASRVLVGNRIVARDDCRIAIHATPVLDQAGLIAARVDLCRPFKVDDPLWPGDLARLMVRVRLGLASWLVDACHEHLRARTAAGSPLLQQQMVKGVLAEVALHLLLADAELDAAPASTAAVSQASAQVTDGVRGLLPLFGASGYLLSGPGVIAHVSELIDNVYVTPAVPACPETPRLPEPSEPAP